MVKPFEDAVFALAPGQISAPVRSQYGWHLILKEDERGIQPLDSMRQQIERQVMRDERALEADKSFARKTRAEYHLPAQMSDADVKVYVTQYKSDADLVVYKCSYKSDAQDNKGLWYFAQYKSDAKKVIYFVDYKSDADLVIYFSEYKSDAGLRNNSKKHLMY